MRGARVLLGGVRTRLYGRPRGHPRPERLPEPREQGRDAHQEDRRGDEGLRALLAETGRGEAHVASGAFEHEGELPDLREQQARAQRGRRAVPQQAHPERRREGLGEHDQHERREHERQVRPQVAHVEQQPDRQEECRAEQDLQGQDLPERLPSEAALAHDESREERAEREAHPGEAADEGRAEADRDDRQQEDLLRAGPRDGLQDPRHDPPGEHEGEHHERRRLPERPHHVERSAALPAEERHEQHHHDDREVLEDQDAEADLPHLAAGAVAVGEELHDDGGAGERDEAAREDGVLDAHAERGERERREAHDEPDLQAAPDEDEPPDAREALEAELDADGEEQQDHADLRGGVDELGIADQPERAGPGEDAREQEADDGHEPDAEREVRRAAREQQQQRELREERGRLGGGVGHRGHAEEGQWGQATHGLA